MWGTALRAGHSVRNPRSDLPRPALSQKRSAPKALPRALGTLAPLLCIRFIGMLIYRERVRRSIFCRSRLFDNCKVSTCLSNSN